MNVILTKEQSDFIEQNGSHVYDGNDWYYLPHWYKKKGEGLYEIVSFEKLSNDVKDFIANERSDDSKLFYLNDEVYFEESSIGGKLNGVDEVRAAMWLMGKIIKISYSNDSAVLQYTLPMSTETKEIEVKLSELKRRSDLGV